MIVLKEEAEKIIYGEHEDYKLLKETKIEERDGRWNLIVDAVFHNVKTNKYYRVCWSKGATEIQDIDPFYEDHVVLIEVELKEVLVKEWVEV